MSESAPPSFVVRLVLALDAVTLGLLAWVVGVVLVSGLDRVWIAEHHVAEPIIAVLVILPLRLALGGPGLLAGPWSKASDWVRRSAAGRLGSERVVDVALVLAVTRIPELAVAFLANVIFPANRLRNFLMPFPLERLAEVLPPGTPGGISPWLGTATTRAVSGRATWRSFRSTRR
jgi:hypothetical protein